MPGAAQKAFQLATNPKADAKDFAEVIGSDEGLSARVIKIANSVYFERGKRSDTIEEAIAVIGTGELRSLLNATTLSEIFPSKEQLRTQLWENDLATAIIAKALAARVLPSCSELAFLGGLMHDVGKLLLLQRNPEAYRVIVKYSEERGVSSIEAEENTYPFNHTQVGALIGSRWNFSSDLIDIIAGHHLSWDECKILPRGTLVAIVKTANIASHALGYGHTRSSTKIANAAEEALSQGWAALGFSTTESATLKNDLARTYSLERELYATSHGSA
jgi:putative nucleotidyltransferase with HDIG domain